jgi:hypothetical protein
MLEGSMDGRGVAAVALRIWGLVLLLGAATAVPGSILTARASPGAGDQAELIRATQTAFAFHLVATAVLGLSLLVWADSVARWAVPETAMVHVGVDMSELLTVGLALVGIVTFIRGFGDAVVSGYVLMRKPQAEEPGALSYLWERQSETLVRAVVDIIAGALLALGRGGIVRAWAQVRRTAETVRAQITRV